LLKKLQAQRPDVWRGLQGRHKALIKPLTQEQQKKVVAVNCSLFAEAWWRVAALFVRQNQLSYQLCNCFSLHSFKQQHICHKVLVCCFLVGQVVGRACVVLQCSCKPHSRSWL
jgi:hypothetical protein